MHHSLLLTDKRQENGVATRVAFALRRARGGPQQSELSGSGRAESSIAMCSAELKKEGRTEPGRKKEGNVPVFYGVAI